MTTVTPRGPERRSSVERRTVDLAPVFFGERDWRVGEERRSGTDRRRTIPEPSSLAGPEEGQD